MKRYDYIEEVKKFNPYHDELGRFTFANAIGAFAPLSGKTENGKRWLEQYKEKHRLKDDADNVIPEKLPELQGSAKQIKWAQDIREKMIKAAKEAERHIGYELEYGKKVYEINEAIHNSKDEKKTQELKAKKNALNEKRDEYWLGKKPSDKYEENKAYARLANWQAEMDRIKDRAGIGWSLMGGDYGTQAASDYMAKKEKDYKGPRTKKGRIPNVQVEFWEREYALNALKKEIREEKSATKWIDRWK